MYSRDAKLLTELRTAHESLYGISFSPYVCLEKQKRIAESFDQAQRVA